MRSLLLLVGLLSAAECALAQSHSRPDPTDPRAPVPLPRYRPAFPDYQQFMEQKSDWKQVNQEVADSPAMGSMQHKPGATMPGMDAKTGDAPRAMGGAAGHDMGSMRDMPGKTKPGTDPKTGDAPKGRGGTASHDMGSMKGMPGKTKRATDAKTGDGAKSKVGAAGHSMGSMQHMPGKTTPGMDKQAATAPMSKEGTAGHDMGSMKDMPGKTMPGMDKPAATAPKSKEGHDTMAMAKPQTVPSQPNNAQTARITGTGSVQLIDKVNGKVKLTHDPIAVLGWPKMTLVFRLKESSLADQVKEGERVEFSLGKSASGYVISGFRKPMSESDSGHKK